MTLPETGSRVSPKREGTGLAALALGMKEIPTQEPAIRAPDAASRPGGRLAVAQNSGLI